MIVELIYAAFVTIFIGLVVLGHVLLFIAIYKCWREDWAIGRRSNRKLPLPERVADAAEVMSESTNFGAASDLPSLQNRQLVA
jgi:hypothetical protein